MVMPVPAPSVACGHGSGDETNLAGVPPLRRSQDHPRRPRIPPTRFRQHQRRFVVQPSSVASGRSEGRTRGAVCTPTTCLQGGSGQDCERARSEPSALAVSVAVVSVQGRWGHVGVIPWAGQDGTHYAGDRSCQKLRNRRPGQRHTKWSQCGAGKQSRHRPDQSAEDSWRLPGRRHVGVDYFADPRGCLLGPH